MVVRFFVILFRPPLAASPGPYILCTRHRRQSRVRLRLGGTPVRAHSPRYTASSNLRRLQAREGVGKTVSRLYITESIEWE
jgi:hypothetical protein